MSRMRQLFKKLGYEKDNGLFFLEDAGEWIEKFSYRIGRVLRDIIKPYAFYSPFHGQSSTANDHPEPLNNPIILFFDHPDPKVEENIPRWTFSFSQAPIVIINRDDTGPLDIYHGYHFDSRNQKWLEKIDYDNEENLYDDFSVMNLSTGQTWKKYGKYFKKASKVDKYLLRNITDARRILIAKDTGKLDPITANRLIGRLLFIRYLIDRNVSFENNRFIDGHTKEERRKSLEQLLKNKDYTYIFFKSITESFNGDLFPLKRIDKEGKKISEQDEVTQDHLDIMHHLFSCSNFFSEGTSYKGYSVQKSFFDIYDFEVIPVELISNIYENFLQESESEKVENKNLKEIPSKRKDFNAYYTPSFLVDYILSETVTPHLAKQEKVSCKVLDPACGSGIFLVETLRKLIEREMQLNPNPGLNGKAMIPDHRLWQLVRENIFGIDIDDGAIEIAIFSICITLLDYKNPKEIESFRFKKLKDENLFGGETADFFNEKHPFNKKFKEDVHLDFIIGNPPWGKIEKSRYKEYIKTRSRREKEIDVTPLAISNDEISQAFMVRTKDFDNGDQKTKCAFVVTGKNLYNADAANWRNYFLNNFCISTVFELSSINNKNTGGPKLFESARQSTAVVFFYPKRKNDAPANSLITHVTARANDYWDYFKTIIIEKQDVKRILQRYFMETNGGYDWLWKVLLHGNILDFKFIKKLKENHPPFSEIIERLNLTWKGGLKSVDNHIIPGKRKSTEEIRNFKYLEIGNRGENNDFHQFRVSPSKSFEKKLSEWIAKNKIRADEKVAQLPDTYYFKGKKLLLKNGLSPIFKAFAAVCDEDLVFTDSICSIKPEPGKPSDADINNYFHTIAALFNSNLFTYFVFNSGTSAGVERTRANFIDFFIFPIQLDKQIGILAEKLKQNYETFDTHSLDRKSALDKEIANLKEELERAIINKYEISKEEAALIDYAVNVAIPVYKKTKQRSGFLGILDPLSLEREENRDYLVKYAEVFTAHFGQRFTEEDKYFTVDIHIVSSFIGFHFKITQKPSNGERIFFKEDTDVKEMVNQIGVLGFHKLSKDLYIRQDIRGFNRNSFYVIKPNQRKSWHKATAYADLSEFVHSLVKAEIKRKSA
jgi:Eco57I restriction-modification methylase